MPSSVYTLSSTHVLSANMNVARQDIGEAGESLVVVKVSLLPLAHLFQIRAQLFFNAGTKAIPQTPLHETCKYLLAACMRYALQTTLHNP